MKRLAPKPLGPAFGRMAFLHIREATLKAAPASRRKPSVFDRMSYSITLAAVVAILTLMLVGAFR